jgi:hypothetical protein
VPDSPLRPVPDVADAGSSSPEHAATTQRARIRDRQVAIALVGTVALLVDRSEAVGVTARRRER